jgi:hypothetical protein
MVGQGVMLQVQVGIMGAVERKAPHAKDEPCSRLTSQVPIIRKNLGQVAG